jgi:catechol 2,3-dioxygenase-like lactoylglutathione lyase family enzyme
MSSLSTQHLVRGVDHSAFPTFDPVGTVRFYRDVLGFPVVHSICAADFVFRLGLYGLAAI